MKIRPTGKARASLGPRAWSLSKLRSTRRSGSTRAERASSWGTTGSAWTGRASRGTVLLAVAGLLTPAAVQAQGDYRHLDDGRPTRVEDAYALKFLEWEWQVGAEGFAAGNESYEAEGVFELKVGIGRGLQAGVEGHGAWTGDLGISQTGLESVNAHLLYNLNQEGRRSPALAFRGDVTLPGGGDLSRSDPGGRLRMMATRSLGTTRLHANVARGWASTADGRDHWEAGFGFDRPFGLSARALVGDVYAELPDKGSARWWADAGIRLQISKQSVVDLGMSFRIDEWVDGNANAGFVVGISRTFGFRGLANVPPYPDPSIR